MLGMAKVRADASSETHAISIGLFFFQKTYLLSVSSSSMCCGMRLRLYAFMFFSLCVGAEASLFLVAAASSGKSDCQG